MAAPTINPTVRPISVKYGAPKEGPAVVPWNLDFTANNNYQIDCSNLFNAGYLSAILTIYADNSQNPNPLIITVPDTGQRLEWPGYSQGYLPVLQGVSLKFLAQSSGAFVIPVFLINFPIAADIWSVNATPLVTNGAIAVSDAILESAVASGFFRSQNYLQYGDQSIDPEFAASKWITGTLTTTSATTIFSGLPGWYLKSLLVVVSGDATLAAAGKLSVTAAESGGTTVTAATMFLGNTAPAATTLPFKLIDMSGLQLTSKVSTSNFQLTASATVATGEIRYTATYGITSFVGG